MAGKANHDYHILEPDIWPLIGSIAALTFTSGMVLSFHPDLFGASGKIVTGLGLVFTFFGGLGGMAIVAGWWGIWDIIAGLILAALWAGHTRKRTGSAKGDASRHAASAPDTAAEAA